MKESLESYVARELHIREDDIFGSSRDAELVMARQICMAMLREFTPRSYNNIGKRYGRDHVTVIHAVQYFKRFSENEKEYRELADKVREAINSGDIMLPVVETKASFDVEPMYEECYVELQKI